MNKALESARKQHRKAIESMYEHICTVFEYQKVKDPVTKLTKSEEVPVLKEQSCKLSYSTVKNATETEKASALQQVVKLFIAPEIVIKEGSKLVVTDTRTNKTQSYKNSGVPAIFSSHQEIVLELFKGWA
ncbi:hypothetical protein CLPUN_03250 [Clostridium puniceum]|uniref:Phage protein n=1 Tax=Clostridium puniceum TaxID=29367 RepID=A0A1S8TX86_9CLOT|nr:hypothetical protein [Clostridium puniceum]OOM82324.1 hypothetical protein CLPUN_03250 [Clostridium puniceum]